MDKEELIEKAVKWLEDNVSLYATYDDDYWDNRDSFLSNFRKAMMEE